MTSSAVVSIDCDALLHNIYYIRARHPYQRIMWMIKSNAYGHGLLAIARHLPETDALGVATIAEAMLLRRAGVSTAIVVMRGFLDADELQLMVAHELTAVIHDLAQVSLMHASSVLLPYWLKVDTGMHRLGLSPGSVSQVYRDLSGLSSASGFLGWMTHLACADERNDDMTADQIACFDEVTSGFQGMRSIANSAGILAYPLSHRDCFRPGIMLYGVSPFVDESAQSIGLKPVMTFTAPVLSVKTLCVGDAVGYGLTWTAEESCRIAIIGAGYGDGYPRHAVTGMPVRLNGKLVSLVGRVSMDMLAVLVPDDLQVSIGDRATLWGEGLPVETIAARVGTLPYELLCRIAGRVDYQYKEPA